MDEIKTPKKEKGASWGECTHHDCGKKCTYINPSFKVSFGNASGGSCSHKECESVYMCLYAHPGYNPLISFDENKLNLLGKLEDNNAINKENKNKPGIIKIRTQKYMIIDSIFDDWSISMKVYSCGCVQIDESHNITNEDVRTYNKCQRHKDK